MFTCCIDLRQNWSLTVWSGWHGFVKTELFKHWLFTSTSTSMEILGHLVQLVKTYSTGVWVQLKTQHGLCQNSFSHRLFGLDGLSFSRQFFSVAVWPSWLVFVKTALHTGCLTWTTCLCQDSFSQWLFDQVDLSLSRQLCIQAVWPEWLVFVKTVLCTCCLTRLTCLC